MDQKVVDERRAKHREYMREWLSRNNGIGRKKARERRQRYIEGLKSEGGYDELKKKKSENEKKYYYRDVELTRIKQGERQQRYRQRHWDRSMFQRAKTRAKKKGLPFNIEISDVVVPAQCPVLGILISPQRENLQENSPSLDRIHPALGYVKGNIRVISQRANRLKCDATAAEMKLVYEDLLRIETP